jgi:hypothetical protein
MREVLEKFNFRDTIRKLEEAGLLFLVVERFKGVDLHPDKVSNHEMGLIFEELIRRFNEALRDHRVSHSPFRGAFLLRDQKWSHG